MVDVLSGLAAVLDGVYTAGVVLEAVDDLEGDGDGASNEQPLSEFLFVPLGDVVAAITNLANSQLGAVNAGSVPRGVGVGLFTFDAVGILDVLKGL